MKILNKKSLALSLALSTSLFASTYEYPQLYKDTRIMGMGGANIAIGGQTSSLFYNTAGLNDIPKDYGWEVDIFNMNVSVNDNFIDFASDLDDATSDDSDTDAQQNAKVLKVVEDYLGDNLHLSTNVALFSIGKKFEKYSFGFMPIGGVYLNDKTHRGGGTAGILEIQGMAYGGIALGIARQFDSFVMSQYGIHDISVGLGVKAIGTKSFYHDFTLPELIAHKDDLGTYTEDNYSNDDSSVVADLGIKATIYKDVTFGLSIQNAGGIGDKDIIEVPMTVGIGLGYSHRYDRSWLNQYQVAVDYTDIFNGYKDNNKMKRTRLGVSGNLFDGWAGTFGVQAGLYQGYPTFGVDFRATMLKIAYTSYAEEVGAYAGQDEDRRHMLQISLGW